MRIVQISLVVLSALAASVIADGHGHLGHGHHHKSPSPLPNPKHPNSPRATVHHAAHPAPVHHRQQQRRPLALAPRPQRRASPLQNLIQRHPVNLPKLRRQPLPDLSQTPIAKLLASNLNGAGRRSAPHAHKAREGTEIFEEGEKPDVIHYVNSPEVGNIDLTDKIDERTPVKVAINSEV